MVCYLKRFAPVASAGLVYAALCSMLEAKPNHIAAVDDLKGVLVCAKAARMNRLVQGKQWE